MAVRFLKSYGRYGVNEIAGFRPSHETFLVEQGFAEPIAAPEPATVQENTMPATSNDAKGNEVKDPRKDEKPEPKTRQTTVGPQTRGK